ncbi:MAG: ACP phosphodiesterase [Armatimonadaceae bacterium]
MNWLAHVALAGEHPATRLGALLADAVGRDFTRFPVEFQVGLACHRWVDGWVERHPGMHASRQRVVSLRRRYSAIAVDFLYDHLLASQWDAHCPHPLIRWEREFVESAQPWVETLDLPEPARELWKWATDHRILARYHDRDCLSDAMRRFSRRMEARLGVPVDLTAALHDLDNDPNGFESDFQLLWADLRKASCKEFLTSGS